MLTCGVSVAKKWYNPKRKDRQVKIEVLVCAISLAAAVLADAVSDDEALDEARKILCTLTIEEKAMLTGGSGTVS